MTNYQGIPNTRCTNCPNRDRCPILCQDELILMKSCLKFALYNEPPKIKSGCNNCPNAAACTIFYVPENIKKEVCKIYAKYDQPEKTDEPIDGKMLRQFMFNHRN
jgi:hypothetical protein